MLDFTVLEFTIHEHSGKKGPLGISKFQKEMTWSKTYWRSATGILNVLLIITARIRRMGEGNVFTLCVSPHLDWGGGVPIRILKGVGGSPSQVWRGGTLSQVWLVGVPCGTPLPRTGWGTSPTSQDWMGYPRPGLDGVPPWPGLDGICHWPGLDGVPPPLSRTGWGPPPPPPTHTY